MTADPCLPGTPAAAAALLVPTALKILGGRSCQVELLSLFKPTGDSGPEAL